MRSININGTVWKWRCGNRHVVARSENEKRHIAIHVDPDTVDRARWKQQLRRIVAILDEGAAQ